MGHQLVMLETAQKGKYREPCEGADGAGTNNMSKFQLSTLIPPLKVEKTGGSNSATQLKTESSQLETN